ncbi:hypothetical protein [Paraconexibacter algicola]|uniref:Uncharacterized protein n=1 Tax=Paraconexibacter algicola TaxID=2133960 RepID=A0A2T4UH79_9ACTN|nr:hypothetical protein [Paraconexibacter algicola]PTL58604.1 hypothetical protein C7Y72_02485 [Paraconexibacter algicola]
MAHGPVTLFDALVSMEVGSRFESLGDSELDLLVRYHEVCCGLGSSTFFSQPIRFSVKAAPEESYERLDHAGRDPLRSMTMDFRQLWMKKEPARFHAILGLLRQRVASQTTLADSTKAILDLLGRRHRDERNVGLMRHVWADDPMGPPIREFTAEQVINDWLYGGAFHFDADAASRVAAWSPVAYEWSLVKAIKGIAVVCWELDVLVGAIVEDQRPTALAA